MPDFTKREIKRSFLKLLAEEPYSHITVKAIISDCGISRSAFYYHYRDIPSLMEETAQEEIGRFLSRYPSVSSVDQCLEAIMSSILEHRQIYLHIYRSVSRELLETNLLRLCESFVSSYIRSAPLFEKLPEKAVANIIRHFKCLLFGLLIDWLENGLRSETANEYRELLRLYGAPAELSGALAPDA